MHPKGAKKNRLAQAIFSKDGPNLNNPEVTRRPKVIPKKYIFDWAKKKNKNIYIFNDAGKAAINSDVIFSDKVVSLNDKVNKKKKIKKFKKFKIDKKIMKLAKKDCIFLHCLPRGTEVDEEVFFSKKSKVWQQAFNRVAVQKSILLYCFGKLR